jgi:hypothetical protein
MLFLPGETVLPCLAFPAGHTPQLTVDGNTSVSVDYYGPSGWSEVVRWDAGAGFASVPMGAESAIFRLRVRAQGLVSSSVLLG